MKILVTGGAGLIGAHFVNYMVQEHTEDTIITLDKLTYAGNLENLKEVENEPNYKFVKGDIADRDFIFDLLPATLKTSRKSKTNPTTSLSKAILLTVISSLICLKRKDQMLSSTLQQKATLTALLKIRESSSRPMSWGQQSCWMLLKNMASSVSIRYRPMKSMAICL